MKKDKKDILFEVFKRYLKDLSYFEIRNWIAFINGELQDRNETLENRLIEAFDHNADDNNEHVRDMTRLLDKIQTNMDDLEELLLEIDDKQEELEEWDKEKNEYYD